MFTAIAATAFITGTSVQASAQPSVPSHSTADNVEIILDHAEVMKLPTALSTTAEPRWSLQADAVISNVLNERDTDLSTLAAQERDVRVDIREASDSTAFGVAIVTAPMGADEDPQAWLFAAEHDSSGWDV